jgi:Arc/MetJ family transcription regulator
MAAEAGRMAVLSTRRKAVDHMLDSLLEDEELWPYDGRVSLGFL